MKPIRFHAWLGFAALMLTPTLVSATTFDVYGAGARGTAMSAQTATPEGAYAVYYNPGALSQSETGVTVGIIATALNAEILLAPRPNGYDVPNLGSDTPTLPSDETINSRSNTTEFDPNFGLVVGGVTSFGIENFRVGMLIFLPTANAFSLTTHHANEQERIFSNQLEFEFIDEATQRLDIEAAISYQVLPWLSFGVGGTYIPGTNLVTNVFLPDPADQGNVVTNADIQTASDWGLLAGTMVTLPHNINLGLSYRGPLEFRVKGENRLQLKGLDVNEDRPVQTIDWAPTSNPGIAALGVSWGVGDFIISGDAKYTFWSAYRGTQNESTDFNNTLSGNLGLEYIYSDASRIRFGTGFTPSPVPEQTGRTNYVDNDRFSLSTGSGHKFVVAQVPFEVAWYMQVQFLLSNIVEKSQSDSHPDCNGAGNDLVCDEVPDDLVNPSTGQPYVEGQGLQTGNPGFPGYSSGGWIGSLGIEVTF